VTDPDPGEPEPSPLQRPRQLVVATVVVVAQAVALLGFAGSVLVEAARGDRSSGLNAGLVAGLVGLWALALGWVARGLWRTHRWSRAPVVVSELLLLAVGIPLAQGGGSWWFGIPLVATGFVGLIAVLSRPVTAALGG
jgi:hypothetical protein